MKIALTAITVVAGTLLLGALFAGFTIQQFVQAGL